MPVARILTRFPEDATAISGPLQSLGYTVEIAPPDEPGSMPADLEIELERCPAGAALARAEQLARSAGADIFVAAEALVADAAPRLEKEAPVAQPPQAAEIAPQAEPGSTLDAASQSGSALIAGGPHIGSRANPPATRDFAFLSSYVPAGRQSTTKLK